MISIFEDLKKEKKIKFDINSYIGQYTDYLLKIKKDYDYYYELYDSIDSINIKISLKDEISGYKNKDADIYSFSNLEEITTYFMKFSLLKSLQKVIEIKSKKDKELMKEIKKFKKKYNHYPDVNDYNDYDNYLKEISLRKEFCIHYIPKSKKDKVKSNFELEPHQLFLKNLLSNNTPYKSILIFHGVGVGKTCSGVSISENFKNNKNKTIILAPEKIQLGWKKNIYDPYKGINQCTGDEYNYEEDKFIKNKEKMSKNKINEHYEMYGYLSFSNSVKNYLESNLKHISKKDIILRKQVEIELIKKKYSDRVLIIDEVHNIRDNSKKSDTSLYIEKVIQHSDNLRLVLLTANPMFNQPDEIISILNMLLLNDNKEIIDSKIIFDDDNLLTDETKEIIYEKSKGYVSYLRGENPITFPYRLYPNKNILDNRNKLDLFDEKIESSDNISFLNLYGSKLKGLQHKIYKNVSKDLKTKKIDEESELIHISNIVYPTKSSKIDEIYGENGFNKCFTKSSTNKYSYKKDIPDFLDLKVLQNYSCKIKSIIESINESEGIVFIYSNWLYSGILPLVLALERNGYQKYDNVSVFNSEKSKPISYHGKTGKDVASAKYMVIAGESLKLTNNFEKELKVATSEENKNGELIKVVIGSSVAAEGLDFKNIRCIHLLEPWHNINKLEQVIGRGIRNYSHFMLEPENRNITIYLHTTEYEDKETIETHLYRRCEKKAKQIGQLELILKEMAIDKYLFQNANIIKENDLDEITIQRSLRDSEIYKVKPYDLPYSRSCSFLEDCQYIKNKSFKITDEIIERSNKTTFSIEHSQSLIDIYKIKISELVLMYQYLDLELLIKLLNEKIDNLIIDIVYHSINQMITDKYTITIDNGIKGYLNTTDDYYYFQPFSNSDIFVPLYYKLNKGIIDKNEYKIENKIKFLLKLPEIIEFTKEEIESKFDELINLKLSTKEEYVLNLKDNNKKNLFNDFVILSYKIDRFKFKDKYLLLYSILQYLLDEIEYDKKYNLLISNLVLVFQSLFIYLDKEKYYWNNEYNDSNKDKLYGGFLYFHERKEYKFFKYQSNKCIITNKLIESDIITNLSLISKNKIYNKNNYGYIEYNKNYKSVQNGLVLKIKRQKDLTGNIFISSSSGEWTSSSGIKYLKQHYSEIWDNINDKDKEYLEEIDYQGKIKINKLIVSFLIENMMRQTNNFIKGDLMWLYKY
jgi:superfamily II DNA or RNA helicase